MSRDKLCDMVLRASEVDKADPRGTACSFRQNLLPQEEFRRK